MFNKDEPKSLAHNNKIENSIWSRKNSVGVQHQSRGTSPWLFMAVEAVAMSSQGENNFDHQISFNTDSGNIGVDNQCTGCISHRIEDFEGPKVNSGRHIKG